MCPVKGSCLKMYLNACKQIIESQMLQLFLIPYIPVRNSGKCFALTFWLTHHFVFPALIIHRIFTFRNGRSFSAINIIIKLLQGVKIKEKIILDPGPRRKSFPVNSILSYRMVLLMIFQIYLITAIHAIELPPILKFETREYQAGNQNWKITEDSSQIVYFANTEGLLEFNGADWSLYPSPNATIIRAIKVVGNRIYSGCYKEFGYWQRQPNGKLSYYSISDKMQKQLLEDEHVWEILAIDDWVIFQTFQRIYLYDQSGSKIRIIQPEKGVWRVFLLNGDIYYQTLEEGLYRISNGKSVRVNGDPVLKHNQICNMFYVGTDLYIQTEKSGLYYLREASLMKYSGKNENIFNQNDIFSCIQLSNGDIVLGTISNGIFILEQNFSLKFHITQDKGLSNNTALSLYEDSDGNLWIGLDNGINCLNFKSSFRSFVDKSGILGTVYTSKLYNGMLYLGTNQGLFAKVYGSHDEFKLVEGIKGQVWNLFEHEGTLFCGHNRGTYIVEGMRQRKIFSGSGIWKFSVVPGRKDLILMGSYIGLHILKKRGQDWAYSHKIDQFDISSRYFEIDPEFNVYISHEYKGVIRILLNQDLTRALRKYLYNYPAKGKNSGLVTFNNDIYYASPSGFYKLNKRSKLFEPEQFFNSRVQPENYISGKMTVDHLNRLWIFSEHSLDQIYGNNIDQKLTHTRLHLNTDLLKAVSGYENIEHLNGSEYLVGTIDGYFIFDISAIHYARSGIRIGSIAVTNAHNETIYLRLNEALFLDHKSNNLNFAFGLAKYGKYIKKEYRYYLENYDKTWSKWHEAAFASYKKLPPGKYIFYVQGRYGDDTTISSESVVFTIRKPFYATQMAIIIYCLLIIVLAYLVNRSYGKYYAKQRRKLIEEHNLKMEIQQLENEQELMRIRNLELNRFIDEKSRELAVSNLDLIRKNELLKIIKDDIKKYRNAPDMEKYLALLSEINDHVKAKDTWDTFKTSFDTFDKDFLKRLHEAHPSLSPGELKLCAYLRLNLASKEIAPLLNISERSVEIKRYRLRKKLNLDKDTGLASYIINF